ncbi:hypothetical protein QQF64_002250 [Cirrhinus molitorella]|uniref:Uncharacterized protein n=1 Tax=Cirrhinus molitorella TaxID=172907 RepID=A0ABR3MPT4_9TELE
MVGNLRKEERAAVSVLCLGRREIRGTVIGCVERSHTDKSQQRKVLYRCLKTGSERWKIIWSFAFRVLCKDLRLADCRQELQMEPEEPYRSEFLFVEKKRGKQIAPSLHLCPQLFCHMKTRSPPLRLHC